MGPRFKSERKGCGFLKTKKRTRPLRTRSTIRCPVNGMQVGWCRMICKPIGELGLCGRPAPHLQKSRIQEALARYAAGAGAGD
jgi:hypothetical protein